MIRDFTDADYPELLILWQRTDMGGTERGDNLRVINRTLAMGGRLIVMTGDNKKVIGSSWMTQDGRRMFLHHFAIDPDFQGRGLSHQLMKESMSWMRECGLQIKLEVHRSNDIARSLYLKYGYKELGDDLVYIIRDPQKKGAD